MVIAILGWGSLIWNLGDLKIREESWNTDGPRFPIEFARISNGNRLTLVIKPDFNQVPTLYATSQFDTIEQARKNLQERENSPNIDSIGYIIFSSGESSIRRISNQLTNELNQWSLAKNYDAVIWTDLGPNFSDKSGTQFNIGNITSFLNSLSPTDYQSAKEYILNAPAQIQTRFRNEIELFLSSRS